MANKRFVFRRFKEVDADILYDEFLKYCEANIQPYFSGPRIGMERNEFLEKVRQASDKQYRPPLITNSEDTLLGVYQITYHRANRYHELMLHLWDGKHLTKSILKEIIDQALHKELPSDSLLVEIPGYAPELKQAADELGLDLTGMIPKYLCHDEGLYSKYYYIITSKKWYSEKII